MSVQFLENQLAIDEQHSKITELSTIIWSQTLKSITLKIKNSEGNIQFSDDCINLYNSQNIISLPLFGRLQTDKCDTDQKTNTVTFSKEIAHLWPHLLAQQTELIQIYQRSTTLDTLDFDSVINGQGQKTGLE
ncbi:hypothetical protein G6F37_005459 [Rhizopus arrhizus]|nr:hypothetical protein G6F38_006800 [Rhizopus arrhizus]KAG1158810.1 hypothetical protein G6F37_005459 [Rhizopus arrhizus]